MSLSGSQVTQLGLDGSPWQGWGSFSGKTPAANHAPSEVSPIGNTTLYQGYTYNWDISGHFTDPDGDPLTFSVSAGTLPTNLSLSSAGVLSGTLTATDTTGSPYAGITIRATDTGALYVDGTAFTITVSATPPSAAGAHFINHAIRIGF